MMVSRFATILINDPEVEVLQRFIMTVNSGDVVQFPIEKERNCVFCNDMDRIKGIVRPRELKEEEKHEDALRRRN